MHHSLIAFSIFAVMTGAAFCMPISNVTISEDFPYFHEVTLCFLEHRYDDVDCSAAPMAEELKPQAVAYQQKLKRYNSYIDYCLAKVNRHEKLPRKCLFVDDSELVEHCFQYIISWSPMNLAVALATIVHRMSKAPVNSIAPLFGTTLPMKCTKRSTWNCMVATIPRRRSFDTACTTLHGSIMQIMNATTSQAWPFVANPVIAAIVTLNGRLRNSNGTLRSSWSRTATIIIKPTSYRHARASPGKHSKSGRIHDSPACIASGRSSSMERLSSSRWNPTSGRNCKHLVCKFVLYVLSFIVGFL